MDDMRKAFEAWVCRDMTREQRIDLMPRYCTVGEPYMDRAMQARWVDWQAATMAERERAELEGYVNGLTTAGNLKPRVPRGDEGTLVLNDIRAQIDEKLANAIRGE